MDKTERLAKGANEEMKAKYVYEEMEQLLADYDFLVYTSSLNIIKEYRLRTTIALSRQ